MQYVLHMYIIMLGVQGAQIIRHVGYKAHSPQAAGMCHPGGGVGRSTQPTASNEPPALTAVKGRYITIAYNTK